jgi:hypothetical protein
MAGRSAAWVSSGATAAIVADGGGSPAGPAAPPPPRRRPPTTRPSDGHAHRRQPAACRSGPRRAAATHRLQLVLAQPRPDRLRPIGRRGTNLRPRLGQPGDLLQQIADGRPVLLPDAGSPHPPPLLTQTAGADSPAPRAAGAGTAGLVRLGQVPLAAGPDEVLQIQPGMPCHPIRQQRDHLQVNVAVNENPAQSCPCLLCQMPSD